MHTFPFPICVQLFFKYTINHPLRQNPRKSMPQVSKVGRSGAGDSEWIDRHIHSLANLGGPLLGRWGVWGVEIWWESEHGEMSWKRTNSLWIVERCLLVGVKYWSGELCIRHFFVWFRSCNDASKSWSSRWESDTLTNVEVHQIKMAWHGCYVIIAIDSQWLCSIFFIAVQMFIVYNIPEWLFICLEGRTKEENIYVYLDHLKDFFFVALDFGSKTRKFGRDQKIYIEPVSR